MTPFQSGTEPKGSGIRITRRDMDTTVLILPRFFGWSWALLLIVLAVGIVLWQWQLAPRLFRMDREEAVLPLAEMLLCAGIMVFFAAILLAGRYRVTVTNESVTRGMSVFGINVLKDAARWEDIRRIACEMIKESPVIRLHRFDGEPVLIEGFRSIEDRDWMVQELRSVWRDVKTTVDNTRKRQLG